jgi:hypothetical protein
MSARASSNTISSVAGGAERAKKVQWLRRTSEAGGAQVHSTEGVSVTAGPVTLRVSGTATATWAGRHGGMREVLGDGDGEGVRVFEGVREGVAVRERVREAVTEREGVRDGETEGVRVKEDVQETVGVRVALTDGLGVREAVKETVGVTLLVIEAVAL